MWACVCAEVMYGIHCLHGVEVFLSMNMEVLIVVNDEALFLLIIKVLILNPDLLSVWAVQHLL